MKVGGMAVAEDSAKSTNGRGASAQLSVSLRTWTARPRRLVAAGGAVLVLSAAGLAVGVGAVADGTSSTSINSSSSTTSTLADSSTQTAGAVGTGTSPTGGATTLGGVAQANAPSVVAASASSLGPGHGAFDAVACSNVSDCIGVGSSPNGTGAIGVTVDGGASWTSPSLPSGIPLLNSVACVDGQHCVAVGAGTILATGDGGTTWSYEPPPSTQTTLLGVTCNASQVCVATGVSPNPTGPYLPQIEMSSDGGSTWTADNIPTGTLGLGSVACPTSQTCIAVGATIMVSTDGGTTWSQRTVKGGMGALSSISCSNESDCVAIGPNPLVAEYPNASAYVVTTTDGGATWTAQTDPAASATLDTVSCMSSGACLMGGASPAAASAAAFEEFSFSSSTAAWTTPAAPPGLSTVTGISCPGVNDCVAVGQGGTQALVDSTANGTTWSSVSLPLS